MAKNSAGVTLIESATDMQTPMNRAVNELSDLIRGRAVVDVAGTGDYTLSITDAIPDGRKRVLRLTGILTGARTIKIPTNEAGREFIIKNATTGSFSLTVKTTASGSTGVTITQGAVRHVYHDDIDVIGIGSESSSNPLAIGWAAYWRLDEASGPRYDSAGGNTLTDNNTVTQAAGAKIGNAAQFTAANSESLSIADNADLSMGDIDFTICAWVYLDTKSAVRDLVTKWGASGQFEYLLVYDSVSDRYSFFVSNNGTATPEARANTFGSPATGAWHFIVAYHDSVGNVIGIKVNDGAANTTAHTTGVFNSTSAFHLGGRAGTPSYHNGRMDEIGVVRRLLTGAEMTELYNAGSGKTYPFV